MYLMDIPEKVMNARAWRRAPPRRYCLEKTRATMHLLLFPADVVGGSMFRTSTPHALHKQTQLAQLRAHTSADFFQ
jgi:hypothetical protein